MKARYKPTRADKQIIAEKAWLEMIECLQTETAVDLIAVIRYFGFGKKRARQYIEYLKTVKSEFQNYDDNGIIKEKIEEELSAFDIDISEIYESPESFKETLRQERVRKNKSVSMAEAYDISKKLDAMREFQKCGGKLSEKRI